MTEPAMKAPSTSDVLHSATHKRLTNAEIAKAVARHQREHPNKNSPAPQKTTPRG